MPAVEGDKIPARYHKLNGNYASSLFSIFRLNLQTVFNFLNKPGTRTLEKNHYYIAGSNCLEAQVCGYLSAQQLFSYPFGKDSKSKTVTGFSEVFMQQKQRLKAISWRLWTVP